MGADHDTWLEGIGIGVGDILEDVAQKVEDTASAVVKAVKGAASNAAEAAGTVTGPIGGETVPAHTGPLGPPSSPVPLLYPYPNISPSPYPNPPVLPKPPPPPGDPSPPFCPPLLPRGPVIESDNLPLPGLLLGAAAPAHGSPSASSSNPTIPPDDGGSAVSVGGHRTASVGRGGRNKRADVLVVQEALNARANAGVRVDGKCGPKTIKAIEAFQKTLGGFKPDGLIQPGKSTAQALGLPK